MAKKVIESFGKPLHPIVGSVAPGGGVAVGIGYDTPRSQDWFRNANAKVSINGYWSAMGETGRQTQRSRLGVFGSFRRLNGLKFFGLGPDSALVDLSSFRLRDRELGTRGWLRVRPDLKLGGIAELYLASLGVGSEEATSIEKIFQIADLPGFTTERHFARYRGYVEVMHPTMADPAKPDATYKSHQGIYQLAVEATRDRDGGLYNFQRVELEVREQFAGFKAGHKLTLHGLVGVTNQDGVVPYYLQYTLGGNSLNAFRADMIGGDGTKATLRSYRNYRFRDRNLVLAQAEYRIPLHTHVDATVFYDAGNVAPRPSDLFEEWKQGTGFSLSYMNKGAPLARMDVGFGSGEGIRLLWTFGNFGF
jgi:hypothetical protein